MERSLELTFRRKAPDSHAQNIFIEKLGCWNILDCFPGKE